MTATIHRLYKIPQNVLPISASTLFKMIREGKIKTVKIGKRATGVMQSEIERFLAEINNA